jgi:hypothetical protein
MTVAGDKSNPRSQLGKQWLLWNEYEATGQLEVSLVSSLERRGRVFWLPL